LNEASSTLDVLLQCLKPEPDEKVGGPGAIFTGGPL